MESCIRYLQIKELITTTTDADGNVIITINNNTLNHPDERVRRFVEATQRWMINPEWRARAGNFQGKDGAWMTVGFETELQNKDTLEHERQEIKFRKQGLSWIEAHKVVKSPRTKVRIMLRAHVKQVRVLHYVIPALKMHILLCLVQAAALNRIVITDNLGFDKLLLY